MSQIVLTEELRKQKLIEAQDKARELLSAIEAKNIVQVGLSEQEVNDQIFSLAQNEFGVTKHWHKRIVRTGINSVLPFKADPENRIIEKNDLVYLDLGPIFEDFEGDIGQTYLLGEDPDKKRLVEDLQKIFQICKLYYFERPEQTGAQYYDFIVEQCHKAGWNYGNRAAGHIVGEFSHIQIFGDLPEHRIWPENTVPMNMPGKDGRIRYWILEIHLVDKAAKYGGFFEDILL